MEGIRASLLGLLDGRDDKVGADPDHPDPNPSPDHPDPVDAAEFLKDRMSDHGLRVERTNDTNDPIVSSAPPSTVVVMTRPEEWLEQFDNLVYFFDSRTLTGASASRNFCCAQQGASQALIYINVDGMCTAICNVASQLQAFSSKLR